jgi:hypothetical protein
MASDTMPQKICPLMMLKTLGKRPVTSAPRDLVSIIIRNLLVQYGSPNGMELQPMLTPTTERVKLKAAKKQPDRAAGPQKRSKIALSRSH